MSWCEHLGDYCPRDEEKTVFKPSKDNYIDNLKDLAEFLFGIRSLDAFVMAEPNYLEWANDGACSYDDDSHERMKEGRKAYVSSYEYKVANAVRFCMREDSAYKRLKENAKIFISEHPDVKVPMSDLPSNVRSMMRYEGYEEHEIKDAFAGYYQPVVTRIISLSLGASDRIPISSCDASDYFPELKCHEGHKIG